MQLKDLVKDIMHEFYPGNADKISAVVDIYAKAGARTEIPDNVAKRVMTAGKALRKLGVQ